jgi:hypothetical protein
MNQVQVIQAAAEPAAAAAAAEGETREKAMGG